MNFFLIKNHVTPTTIPARDPMMVKRSIDVDASIWTPSGRIILTAATPMHDQRTTESNNRSFSLFVSCGIFIRIFLRYLIVEYIKASTVRQLLTSAGLPTKWSNRTGKKSTKELAQIAKNQIVMVVCNPWWILYPHTQNPLNSFLWENWPQHSAWRLWCLLEVWLRVLVQKNFRIL
mgnify:CR=1 FL=1